MPDLGRGVHRCPWLVMVVVTQLGTRHQADPLWSRQSGPRASNAARMPSRSLIASSVVGTSPDGLLARMTRHMHGVSSDPVCGYWLPLRESLTLELEGKRH